MSHTAVKTAVLDVKLVHRASLLFFLTLAIYIMAVTAAYAISTPMGDVLCAVVLFIYGNLGRSLATLAIMVVGVGATLGKVSWGLAITVAVGISVIFNALGIMSMLTGQAADC